MPRSNWFDAAWGRLDRDDLVLPDSVVGVAGDDPFHLVIGEDQPLTTATWAPLLKLLAHMAQRHWLISICQKDPEDGLEGGHIREDEVLLSRATLSDDPHRV